MLDRAKGILPPFAGRDKEFFCRALSTAGFFVDTPRVTPDAVFGNPRSTRRPCGNAQDPHAPANTAVRAISSPGKSAGVNIPRPSHRRTSR